MKAVMRRAVWVTVLAASASALPQRLPWQTSNAANPQLVHFLYPQQVTVQAAKPQVVELHFRINQGLHINSHEPRQKSLIPTQLMVAQPSGVDVKSVDFPPGSDYAFPADPAEKLSVYSGELVLRMHLTAQRGDHLLEGALRYQACDMRTCFPPRTTPLSIDVIAH